MASTQHTPTELEAAGDLVLPAADELAGRFPLTPNAHPVSYTHLYASGHAGLAEHRSRTRPWRARGFGVPTEVGGARKMGL